MIMFKFGFFSGVPMEIVYQLEYDRSFFANFIV